MKINNIACEYLDNPLGISIASPRITWNLTSCSKQKAFEIKYRINDDKEKTSNIINSSSMHYDFNEVFTSRDHVSYTITVYADEDKNCISEEHFFEIGLLSPNDWKGRWIRGDYKVNKKKRYPCDYFKKEFNLTSIKKARLYISALGVYEASLNDNRVGDFVMAPGSSDYRKRVQYQVYDVTTLLKEGTNTFNVILGDGWYRGSIGAKGFSYIFGKETKFIAQLEIVDKQNKVHYVLSDETFAWSNDGPLTFADFKNGEKVNNNLAPTYSSKVKISEVKVPLKASNNNFAKEQEKFSPHKEFTSKTGKQIFEFKQNLAGYLSFEVDAHQGDTIDIVLGEMVDDNNDVTLHNVQCNTKGRLSPLQEVHFICKEGHNIYHPKFMYAGFKYASFSSPVKIKKDDVQQIALYTTLKIAYTFKSSNELINTFVQNTLWSLKSNSFDVPTDCPTRERMGWTGDSQVFFNTASYLVDYAAFSRKHLVDVYDRQQKNGCLPQIAPYNAEDWFMNVMNGSVGWADVGVLIPYRFYKKYGDERLLIKYYDRMVKYANFMINRCGRAKGIYAVYAKPLHLSKENKKFGINTGQSYGEWAEPSDVKQFVWTDFACPHPEESMAYTYYILTLMNEIGDIVGRDENKTRFTYYANGIKKAYQELVTKKDYSLDTNRQAKLVRPLYMNLLTPQQEEYAKKRLIQALDFYKWRLGTGFLSTPFILDVLTSIDPEYAYRLLENEEMPGWLYMAKHSTGTIWEGWEGPKSQLGISSLNHYSKGAMVEWLFHGMCGINVDKENHFTLKPIIGGKETSDDCSYDSIYGTVSLSWKKDNGHISIDITIPSNTTGTFIYSNKEENLITGKYHFDFE